MNVEQEPLKPLGMVLAGTVIKYLDKYWLVGRPKSQTTLCDFIPEGFKILVDLRGGAVQVFQEETEVQVVEAKFVV